MATKPHQPNPDESTNVFSVDITDSSLHEDGLIDRLIGRFHQIAQKGIPQGGCDPTDNSDAGFAPPALKRDLGMILGRAMIRGDRTAVQDITNIVALNSEYYENNIFLDTLNILHQEGRLDLFRPMVVLFRDACVRRWRADAPNRTGDFPPAFQTQDFPDFHQFTAAEALMARNKNKSITRGLRGATAWFVLANNMQHAVGGIDTTDSSDGGGDDPRAIRFFRATTDAVATIPEARPWAFRVLAGALGRRGLLWRAEDGEAWQAGARRLADLMTAPEAAALLRLCADALMDSRNWRDTGKAHLVEQLAQELISRHPHQTGDAWLRSGPSPEMAYGLRIPGGLTDMRAEVMQGPAWCDATGNVQAVAKTYDTLAGWLGKDLLEEASAETRERLTYLCGHGSLKGGGPGGQGVPALRAAVDRWALTDQSTEVPTTGRTAAERTNPRRRGL